MSKRNKLLKFSELLSLPNVFENFDAKNPTLTGENGVITDLKGKWAKDHFQNDYPITLELACGKGDYTKALAKMFSERNFIGVDIKGARIWKGAKEALEEGINNAAFLRTRIEQISFFFEKEEVDEIWITFPDPFLKMTKRNRRLTSLGFLYEYAKILKPGGIIHLKTDDPTLYEYSLNLLKKENTAEIVYYNEDIYAGALYIPELDIKTYYERMHLAEGKTIKYIQFVLKNKSHSFEEKEMASDKS